MSFFFLEECETFQDREIILWILSTLKKMKWKATPHLAQTFLRSHVALVSAMETVVVLPCWNTQSGIWRRTQYKYFKIALFIDFYVWSRLFFMYVGYREDRNYFLCPMRKQIWRAWLRTPVADRPTATFLGSVAIVQRSLCPTCSKYKVINQANSLSNRLKYVYPK